MAANPMLPANRMHSIFRILPLLALLAAVDATSFGAEPAPAPGTRRERVQIVDDHPGTGTPIATGAFAVVHYTAYLLDPAAPGSKGAKFDSSRDRGQTLAYVYGYKRAIPGLEDGMAGMRVGGTRTILVPPRLGYDGLKYRRPPDVPDNSGLVFDVELIDVVPQAAPPDR
jgi:FKBP-type peptidyl-prolyl cis-trans isomerase FkpA